MLLAGGAVGAFVTDSFELSSRPRPAQAAVRCEPERDRKVYWIAPARAAELGPRIDRWVAENEGRFTELRARWLGRVPYREALDLQRALHASPSGDYLLLLEHPPVYTLGRQAKAEHVLTNASTVGDLLAVMEARVHRLDVVRPGRAWTLQPRTTIRVIRIRQLTGVETVGGIAPSGRASSART